MVVTGVSLRDFRCYERAEFSPGPALTVIHGHNGAGKTNLLEGLYFACTGRSCRTTNEREVVRFGARGARAAVHARDTVGETELSVAFEPGQPKRMRADGVLVERLADVDRRPLVSVFLPDRLELVKGPPALRRAHLDQFVAALWPARAATRRSYSQALAQRNALLLQIRGARTGQGALDPWDARLAELGQQLRADRSSAVGLVAEPFTRLAAQLGLEGDTQLVQRPRARAAAVEEFAAELRDRRASDIERGFSGHGPHRDDVVAVREGRELRAYGSQGEQRLALLALLLAEREALSAARDHAPLMLLDDVMSELDPARRELLSEILARGGQSVITTADASQVPPAGARATHVGVSRGVILQEPVAA